MKPFMRLKRKEMHYIHYVIQSSKCHGYTKTKSAIILIDLQFHMVCTASPQVYW